MCKPNLIKVQLSRTDGIIPSLRGTKSTHAHSGADDTIWALIVFSPQLLPLRATEVFPFILLFIFVLYSCIAVAITLSGSFRLVGHRVGKIHYGRTINGEVIRQGKRILILNAEK